MASDILFTLTTPSDAKVAFRLIVDQKPAATVYVDGRVEFGEGFDPDAAGRRFWEVIARAYPSLRHHLNRFSPDRLDL